MRGRSAKQTVVGAHRALAAFLISTALFAIPSAAQKPASGEIQVQKCWEHKLDGTVDRRLAADGSSIFTVRGGSVVEAVTGSTGALLWSSDVGGNIDSDLAAADGSVFLVRHAVAEDKGARGSLVALSAATGITKWTAALPDAGTDVTLAVTGGVVLVVSNVGSIVSADARDGKIIWSKQSPSDISGSPFLAGTSLYFASQGRNVGQMSLDGVLSTAISSAPFALTALARSDDGTIVAGDERGQVTTYSGPAGKVIWKFTSGAAVSSLLLKDSSVIAASNDNFIYALTLSGGGRIWKKRVAGRVQAMRLVGDGLILVETAGEKEVQLLDAGTGKTAAQISFPPDEIPVAALALSDSVVTVLSSGSLYLYATGGCPAK